MVLQVESQFAFLHRLRGLEHLRAAVEAAEQAAAAGVLVLARTLALVDLGVAGHLKRWMAYIVGIGIC
jgi:hypothetical protein